MRSFIPATERILDGVFYNIASLLSAFGKSHHKVDVLVEKMARWMWSN
ncbi:hypothetical protein [Thiothrix subterranea]|uniref:Uncharacterized protein n=1 Tax=Thiothrix subterranea TaxID=2735563 RepID=A0AA51MMN6_9GAMM|nr:hypothetical protein [Thiothrix subterranea]MDQ5768799.1 hypothetical protein [Thiothrix subterranea]WML86519.1 hypothetical protein RCG00_19825 [Thiothrix subterranea]